MGRGKKLRRKTLSHDDLEAFLCDLGSQGIFCKEEKEVSQVIFVPEPTSTTSILYSSSDSASSRAVHRSPKIDTPGTKECTLSSFHGIPYASKGGKCNISSSVSILDANTCRFQTPIIKSSGTAIPHNSQLHIDSLIYQSDLEGVRLFVKEMHRSCNENDFVNVNIVRSLQDIGRKIFEDTSYKLLSSRYVYPHQFIHSPASVEGKKEILLRLSPMLIQAEKERQRDYEECQQHTRCKIGKGNTKNCTYVYTDIDTKEIITSEEYKRKYVDYINRKKITRPAWLTCQRSNASAQVSLPMDGFHFQSSVFTKEHILETQQFSEGKSSFTYFSSLSAPSKFEEEKYSRSGEKKICESWMQFPKQVEIVTQAMSRDRSGDKCDVLNQGFVTVEPVKLSKYPTGTSGSKLQHDGLSWRVETKEHREYDCIHSNGNSLIVSYSESRYNPISEKDHKVVPYENCGAQRVEEHVGQFENLDPHKESSSHRQSTYPQYDNVPSTVPKSWISLKDVGEEGIKEAEEHAESRLKMRYDTIVWKYHWEVTSAHAAMVASNRFSNVIKILP